MALTPREAIEEVRSGSNTKRIKEDKLRFNVFQGQLRDEIIGFLRSEFLKPETIEAMSHRVVPINIVQKIINKLAMVYREAPIRMPVDGNENDQMMIDLYTNSFNLNEKMKWANRYFKLQKNTALEPFLDRNGVPRLRALPSQSFTPVSDDPIQPDRPTGIVKHVRSDASLDAKKMRFHYWTDENFWILDGEGNVVGGEMVSIDNPEGVNPFGKIPFVYIPESDDGNLIPISDDDLISMQFVICALLSDLTFASKYQAWSIYTITGANEDQNIGLNPNSVVSLPEGASLDVVKAQIDIESMLSQVEAQVGMLLTTKNLSVGDITGQVSASNAASGVAKMIDRSETTEDRMDQEAFFINGEKELWDLWAHHMLPVYVASGRMNPEYQGQFTNEFELSIEFADQKPVVSDKELIELEIMKLDNGLTTKKRALQNLLKDKSEEEIDMLIEEIEEVKKSNVQSFMGGLVNRSSEEQEASNQEDESED